MKCLLKPTKRSAVAVTVVVVLAVLLVISVVSYLSNRTPTLTVINRTSNVVRCIGGIDTIESSWYTWPPRRRYSMPFECVIAAGASNTCIGKSEEQRESGGQYWCFVYLLWGGTGHPRVPDCTVLISGHVSDIVVIIELSDTANNQPKVRVVDSHGKDLSIAYEVQYAR